MKHYTSLIEMVEDFRTMPLYTDFGSLLKKDFGVEVKADAELYYKEYLWKYMVQAVYLGYAPKARESYARKQLETFLQNYPHVAGKYLNDDAVPAIIRRVSKSNKVEHPDGAIVWNPTWDGKGKYEGFIDGKVKVRCYDPAKVAERLREKGVIPLPPMGK